MSTDPKPITIKLLVDKKANKVLFAEAKKDFVDFLLGLLTLPIGTIIRVLTKNEMVGCLGNLYESVEKIDDTYIQPNQEKDTIVKPIPTISHNIPLSIPNDAAIASVKYFKCPNYNHPYITCDSQTTCPQCRSSMSIKVSYVAPKSAQEGFVKAVTTYMVTDNLAVTPMSTISCISVLKEFNVPDMNALEEMEVGFSTEEGKKLLLTALQSKTVLSEVFLWEEIEVKMFERTAEDGHETMKSYRSTATPPSTSYIPAMEACVDELASETEEAEETRDENL